MNKETITLLAKYNQVVNQKMNAVIQTLNDEEWNRDLGGYFKSVRGAASHIYITDFTYLKRFGNLREFTTLRDPLFGETYAFKDLLFPSKDEYLVKQPALDNLINGIINEITGDDLQGRLKYSDSTGKSIEFMFPAVIMQLFNHATHHRGAISLYLELLGRDNDYSSFFAAL
ncbi:MAG: hypothetical protein LBP76_03655 [Treponema sp.]|jgi:uncharacterized damage-inducible protein DinB|nr:hypothetical protein [Treponema sp.]